MAPTAILARVACVAAVLFVVACSGDGDDFEAASGATIEVGELEGLIGAAVAGLSLEQVNSEVLEAQEPQGPSCFEVVSGQCNPSTAPVGLPGYGVFYRDTEGRQIGLQLQLAVDELQAGDMVDGQATAMKSIETMTQRQLSQPIASGPITGSACDSSAGREDDTGCAWQDRSAPSVGDEAQALKSEVVEGNGYAMVAFSRGSIFGVVMVRQHEDRVPAGLADDIAQALDEQIKLALSQ